MEESHVAKLEPSVVGTTRNPRYITRTCVRFSCSAGFGDAPEELRHDDAGRRAMPAHPSI
ncbi:hypothetical protein MINT15_04060 [Saccharomonospora viridis]|uniref:Uncharacterized protein n=1 Tax=Saccharomonospora viridis TaxID=1852 RepID=A0A837DFW4_9PSEU|nr:hypothetical protein MINT15_04060 [Saccharomonospora viridis]